MATVRRYKKPNMAALPPDIGRRVIEVIRSTPAPDRKKMHEEAMRIEKDMIEEMRKMEINQRLKPRYDEGCIFMYQNL